jgi:catalase
MTAPEQRHIVSAFVFELSKVRTVAVRRRVLGHLANINAELQERVAAGLGMEGQADRITPTRPLVDMKPSPALSLIAKAPKTLKGRKVGLLVTDGADATLVQTLRTAVEKAGATLQIVAPKIGGVTLTGGAHLDADHQVAGGPSVLFDAVVVAPSAGEADTLARDAAAIDWIRDAFGHLKVIGVGDAAWGLVERAGVSAGDGVIDLKGPKGVNAFIAAAKDGRIWERESLVRPSL